MVIGSRVGRLAPAGEGRRAWKAVAEACPASRRGGRVVYCGGLENRFGLTTDGGSNPSLSARLGWDRRRYAGAWIEKQSVIVSDLVKIGIWAAVVGTLFVVLWRKGYVRQLTDYVQQTREELRKCTWPTWDELKGSTVIAAISIVLLGGYTVLVDQLLIQVFLILKL